MVSSHGGAGGLSLGAACCLLVASCSGGFLSGEPDCTDLSAGDIGDVRSVGDDFDDSGPLSGYVTNNADVLPEVEQRDGRYRALLEDNTDDKTLHFFSSQGRLDARLVSFPFDYVARNIGIGTVEDSQAAPPPVGDETFVFAGVQVHDPDLDARNSSHVVVGHRGGTHFTVEGKNTCDGTSTVDDAGPGVAPSGRVDLRIVGNDDGTLTVYHQPPNLDHPDVPDSWMLYRGSGTLPGEAPAYGGAVYIGLITYAQGDVGLPFVGTADAIQDYATAGG